jgi:hypothetical protein
MIADWATNRLFLADRLEDDEPALLAALHSALTASTRMQQLARAYKPQELAHDAYRLYDCSGTGGRRGTAGDTDGS